MPASLGVRSLNYGSPVNTLAPLNRGLRGWWKVLPQRVGGARWLDLLDTTSASLVEMFPSTATRGFGAQAPPGGDGSVQLDGVSRVHAPARSWMLYTGGGMTVSLWVRITTGEDGGYLISKPWNASSDYNWTLYVGSDGTLYLAVGGATTSQFSTTSTLPFGAWHWLAWTFSADAKMRLWINRALVLDQTHSVASWTPPNGNSNLELVVGNIFPYAAPWTLSSGLSITGRIDDLRLWTRALAAPEVLEVYQASRLGYPQELNWLSWPPGWAGAAAAAGGGIVRQMMQHAA